MDLEEVDLEREVPLWEVRYEGGRRRTGEGTAAGGGV